MTQAFNLSQFANKVNTSGQADLTTAVTGTLPVTNLPTVTVPYGGTGLTTLTSNNVILGNGTSAVQFVAPSTNGNVLTSNGTTWTSAAAPSSAPTTAQVLSATAGATNNAVGTYALLGNISSGVVSFIPNTNYAGSALIMAGIKTDQNTGWNAPSGTPNFGTDWSGSALSGTWKCMGGCEIGQQSSARARSTLFLRVA